MIFQYYQLKGKIRKVIKFKIQALSNPFHPLNSFLDQHSLLKNLLLQKNETI